MEPSASDAKDVGRPRRLALTVLGALVLIAAVLAAGSAGLDSPWIQGDEHVFIAANPDVTGDEHPVAVHWRWLRLFGELQEDLYQPFTILTYAVEWVIWGDQRVPAIRRTDVLLHALNGLLFWAVMTVLLRRVMKSPVGVAMRLGWAMAMVWAMHPMLVTTFAADMGRTHLLAATFALAALLLHLRALTPAAGYSVSGAGLSASAIAEPRASSSGGRVATGWFAASFFLLALAMLNKPVVGWVLVAFGIEAVLLGPVAAIRSRRVWSVAALCLGFALLTLITTSRAKMIDGSQALFGDPPARAALGLFLYLRNAFWPGPWIRPYYPPDPMTGWGYAPVWLGLLAMLVLVVIGLGVASRRPAWRMAGVGALWVLGAWLPLSGLIGARVVAAQDRYFYQPLMAVCLMAAAVLALLAARTRRGPAVAMAACAGAGLFGAAALPVDAVMAAQSRSTLQRAIWSAAADPADPRLAELVAAACKFGWTHETPEDRLPEPPDQRAMQLAELVRATELAATPTAEHYFPTPRDQAAFHRRLAFEFLLIRQPELSLAQAEQARALDPEAVSSWGRVAHALQALNRLDEARSAYEEIERRLTPAAPDRGLLLTEFGRLLLYRFQDLPAARARFVAALQSQGLPDEVRDQAKVGLARCEVLIGEGLVGLRLAEDVLAGNPGDFEAGLVVALYHLRSHHFEPAYTTYAALLAAAPTHYEALRGFHEACAALGRWSDSREAWQAAVMQDPDELAYRSYLVWAMACAGTEQTAAAAEALMEEDPDNPFARLGLAVVELRADRVEAAVESIRAARRGRPVAGAREAARAEATLRVMLERGEIAPEALLLMAALQLEQGDGATARESAARYLGGAGETKWRALAEELMAVAATQPAR